MNNKHIKLVKGKWQQREKLKAQKKEIEDKLAEIESEIKSLIPPDEQIAGVYHHRIDRANTKWKNVIKRIEESIHLTNEQLQRIDDIIADETSVTQYAKLEGKE